ncbi:MAG TPA: hypothetical protein VGF79_14080 [Bacteroidia bacterium]
MNIKITITLVLSFLMNCLLANNDNLIQKAENIWVNKGIHQVLLQVKTDLKMSDKHYYAFRNKFNSAISADKQEFFNKSTQSDFLNDNALSNYQQWLTQKQVYYYSEAQRFLNEYIDSDYSDASSAMSAGPCAHSNCSNIGFEAGDISTWEAYQGDACGDPGFGSSVCHGFMPSGLSSRIQIQSGPGFDVNVGPALPVVSPGGSYSLRLENQANGGDASKIARTFYVDASNSTYVYKYAVVLEDPGSSHADQDKPYFSVRLFVLEDDCSNPSGNQIECASYTVFANPSNSELQNNFKQVVPGSPLYYRGWTEVAIPLHEYIGKNLRVEFVVSDCAFGGHLGYAYLDGECLNSQPIIGVSCAGGERTLTAPNGYISYWWSGEDIKGSNNGISIKTGGGKHKVIATSVSGCVSEFVFDVDTCPYTPVVSTCNIGSLVATPSACNANGNTFDLNGTITFSSMPITGVLIISNGYLSQLYNLPLTSPFNFTFKNLIADGSSKSLKAVIYNSKFISSSFISCQTTMNYTAPAACLTPTLPCSTCLSSFNPEPGKYIISAWVKEVGAAADVETYTNPYIQIQFSAGTTVLPNMLSSGKIIEGWQRVFYEFDIPIGATDIKIVLGSNAGAVLFDDIRIHSAAGSFVSYVYDPVSLKIVAFLDENNFATLYEYDSEGVLIRLKKETERGIMTIKETRDNTQKR